MEQLHKLAIAWALVAFVIYKFIASYLRERHYAREALRRGCKPLPRLSNYYGDWFMGIEVVFEAMRADSKQKFPEWAMERNRLMDFKVHQYKILGANPIIISHPDNVKAVLATQFNDFALGPLRRGFLGPLLGNGIFTADGKMWEHSRAMMRPQFAREQVQDLDLEELHVQNMMKALPTEGSGWTSQIDLQDLFFRLTLDSACEFLFGESVDSQLAALPSSTPDSYNRSVGFAKAFDRSQKFIATRSRFATFYWLVSTPQFRRDNKTCHEFIDHFVRLALSKPEDQSEKSLESGTGKKNRYVFLDALASQTRDPIELRTQLLNILLAGRDTTASLLGWAYYELARHPEIYKKLRAAVLADFGPYQDPKTSTPPPQLDASVQGHISFSKLKACTYLQHVLNETLRLHPVVPFNFRYAQKDTTLPKGGGDDGESPIFVRKGQQVEYSMFVIHRNPKWWGEDAQEWKPERWVGRKPGWEYLPFNGGPRICLGQQFALIEASYVFVRMLQRFDGIQNLNDSDTKYNLTLTSSPGGGVRVRLHEAEKA